ncbi:MAG: MmgE/PrpD family protein [Terriglobia bacterium]
MTALHKPDMAQERSDVSSPTLALAKFAAALRGEHLPQEVSERIGELFLDYLRVASIGASTPWSEWARAYVARLGGKGKASILFSSGRTNPVQAAFLNATYAGSIDSDDTHVGSMLHPGTIVFSAALAVGTEIGASGRDFLAAVAAGYEAMIRIGLAVQPTHFRRGFQSTSTCGGFGAATAAAKLLFRGDAAVQQRRIAETLGLVGSFAGGLTQFYHSGSTVKRIHAARAAENGVAAALLASEGFSGPVDVLEGKDGFARAYADEADFGLLTDELGNRFRLLEVAFKVHACSARIQAAVEGVLELGRDHGFRPEDIAEICVGVPSVIAGRLTIPRPVDLQAAQMSLPFSVALAASKARKAGSGFALDVADYGRGLSDPAVQAVESRVRCNVDSEVEAATTAESVAAKVVVRLRSGTEHASFVLAPKGSPSRPLTHGGHVQRFQHELIKRLPERCCTSLVESAENLARVDSVGSISDLLVGGAELAGPR